MPWFITKPVRKECLQWKGGDTTELRKFCGLHWGRNDAHEVTWAGPNDGEGLVIWNKLESQWLCCPVGHWIICGLRGELYPCDPEVFAASYEPDNHYRKAP